MVTVKINAVMSNKSIDDEKFNLWRFIGSLNVEPCAFLLTFASMSRLLSIQQLFQDKLCIQKFNQTEAYCSNLAFEETSPIKQSILSEVTSYNFYDTLIAAFPGIFWCLFVGSWCDKYKGKLLDSFYRSNSN